MWVQEFLNVLCLPLAATDGRSPEQCYFRIGEGEVADEREGENERLTERLVLFASSSNLDLQKVFLYSSGVSATTPFSPHFQIW